MITSIAANHAKGKSAQDKIFGANAAAVAAAAKYGADKVTNATIGAILDEDEKLVCLPTIEKVYRGLATNELIAYAPISGLPDYAATEDTKILWCPAVISYDESGAGKITWFDVAPGLVYSLSADNSAGRDALLDMANRLFTPAQGEVG